MSVSVFFAETLNLAPDSCLISLDYQYFIECSIILFVYVLAVVYQSNFHRVYGRLFEISLLVIKFKLLGGSELGTYSLD